MLGRAGLAAHRIGAPNDGDEIRLSGPGAVNFDLYPSSNALSGFLNATPDPLKTLDEMMRICDV